MECSCYECKCMTCGVSKTRRLEFKIYRVRGLNKPFTRTGLAFGKILHLIDAMIGIATFGYIETNLYIEWIDRDIEKFSQYIINDEKEYGAHKRFKLRPFEFKICWTRPEGIFGHILQMMDAIIGVMTFAHFDSFLYDDWNSIKLAQYIEKYRIGIIKSSK